MMTTVEHKLAQEVEAESDAIHNGTKTKQFNVETELIVRHNTNDSKISITPINTDTNTNMK